MMTAFNILFGITLIAMGASSFCFYTFRDQSSNWKKLDDYTYSFKGGVAIILGICVLFQVIDLAGYLF